MGRGRGGSKAAVQKVLRVDVFVILLCLSSKYLCSSNVKTLLILGVLICWEGACAEREPHCVFCWQNTAFW